MRRSFAHARRATTPRPRRRACASRKRRVAQALRLAADDGRTYTVANLHCTSFHDRRLAQAELLRAAWFATATAQPEDVVVLAGDFNVTAASPALHELTSEEWGFSRPGPGIDHVLVRGAETSEPFRWPAERRRHGGRLLSDHAPVEVRIA